MSTYKAFSHQQSILTWKSHAKNQLKKINKNCLAESCTPKPNDSHAGIDFGESLIFLSHPVENYKIQ